MRLPIDCTYKAHGVPSRPEEGFELGLMQFRTVVSQIAQNLTATLQLDVEAHRTLTARIAGELCKPQRQS